MVRNFTLKYNLYWPDNQGRNEGCKGVTIPRASSHWGAKSPNNFAVPSAIQYMYSQKTLGSNMGAPNLFLAPGVS